MLLAHLATEVKGLRQKVEENYYNKQAIDIMRAEGWREINRLSAEQDVIKLKLDGRYNVPTKVVR